MNIYYVLEVFVLVTVSYWAFETYMEKKRLEDEEYSLY